MEYRRVWKWEYAYDENNRLIKSTETVREPFPNLETNKVEFMERSLGSTTVAYDWAGNNTSNDSYSFEYDRHENWIIKWRKQRTGNVLSEERTYKYFGADDFENPYDTEEEYYEEEG
jgi:hypothetical protein